MAGSFDYANKPIVFTFCEPGAVATASSTVARFAVVVPADMYIDELGMHVATLGGGSGNTEISVSKNTRTTGRLFSTNVFQLAYNNSTGYTTLTRSSLNTTGVARVAAGDRLLVYVFEKATTCTNLTFTLSGMGV